MSDIENFSYRHFFLASSVSYEGPLLPSRGAIFSDFLRRRALPSAKEEEILEEIAEKCIKMWRNAGLSTTRKDTIIKYILDLYDRFVEMNKVLDETTDEFKGKIFDFFTEKLNVVFKIGTKKSKGSKGKGQYYPQIKNYKNYGKREKKLLADARKAAQKEHQQAEEERLPIGEPVGNAQALNHTPTPADDIGNRHTQLLSLSREMNQPETPKPISPKRQPETQAHRLLDDLFSNQGDPRKLHELLQPVALKKCQGLMLDILHTAFKQKSQAIAHLILREALSLTENKHRRNALVTTIRLDWPEEVKLLLQLGAKVGETDELGCTGLHYAFYADVSDNMMSILSLQLLQENSIKLPDHLGVCPLHILCSRDINVKIIKSILSEELEDINKQVLSFSSENFGGYTPLHFALEFEQLAVAETLLDFKANVYICNDEGINSYELAKMIARKNTNFKKLVIRIENIQKWLSR